MEDVWEKDKIEIQLKTLIESPEASFCYSNCRCFNSSMSIKYFKHFNLLQKPSNSVEETLQDFIIPSPTMIPFTKFLLFLIKQKRVRI